MRMPVLALLALCAALLAACSGQDKREAQALGQRLERVEQEAQADRARRDAELAALRQEVDGLKAALAEAADKGPDKPADKPGKSPRAALRESIHDAYEASRQAVSRLGQRLDKSITPQKKRTDAPPPAETPAKPE